MDVKTLRKSNVFLLILGAFIFGIVLASFIQTSYLIIYFICLITLIFFFLSKKRRVKIIALLVVFFIIGFIRYQLSIPKIDSSRIQYYNGQKITLIGLVAQEPDTRQDKILLTLNLKQADSKKVKGKVLVSVPFYSEFGYGQSLKIKCQIQEPENFDNFNYQQYLARYNIYSVCWRPESIEVIGENQGNFVYTQILTLKNKIKMLINQYLTEPQSSLLSALLLGLKKELPTEVKNWFSLTGTSHIVAVSGLHIIVMIMIIDKLGISIFQLNRNKRFYFVLIFILFFVSLIGFPASAIRASIMGLLMLYAKKIGRLYQSINVIILAAVVMLLINPKLLRWDIGFQLSFLAVFGIIYLEPYFNRVFRWLPNFDKFPLRSYWTVSLAAYLFTLPLILYYFGNLSLIAPLTNILILGTLSWVMFSGIIFVVGGLVWPFFAAILVWPAWLILTYILEVVQSLAGIPYLSFNLGQIHWIFLIILYGALIFAIIKINEKYNSTFDNY